ncbi:hypothetical protein BG006_001289 [Podila minutissima]|uniref:Small ribosomal subunit protein mS38 n=1 Tax=Podila minutissima TaxID=64525 RepID=A0A9P5VH60_9FUNG|nr:hypothetical protein BG006_001289 [Podila minutissima]
MLATFSAVKRAASPLMGLARNTNTLRTIVASHRFQSSSSWSNNNSNNIHDLASMVTSDNISANAALGGLHRVDLAHGSFFALHRPLLGINNGPMFAQNFEEFEGKYSDEQLSAYFSTLRPFTPPTGSSLSSVSMSAPEAEQAVQKFFEQIDGQLQEKSIVDPLMDETNVMHMTSVLRKRRIKMRKHKYKKLRKRTRALRKKLGK